MALEREFEFMSGQMEEATRRMRECNGGGMTKKELLVQLEDLLGKSGMDMLALFGIMCANEATDNLIRGLNL